MEVKRLFDWKLNWALLFRHTMNKLTAFLWMKTVWWLWQSNINFPVLLISSSKLLICCFNFSQFLPQIIVRVMFDISKTSHIIIAACIFSFLSQCLSCRLFAHYMCTYRNTFTGMRIVVELHSVSSLSLRSLNCKCTAVLTWNNFMVGVL